MMKEKEIKNEDGINEEKETRNQAMTLEPSAGDLSNRRGTFLELW